MQRVTPSGQPPPALLEDEESREEFLFFGFLPRVTLPNPLAILGGWEPPADRSMYEGLPAQLAKDGVRAFSRAIEVQAALGGSGDQVVFLSGGLDSRAILGGLLKHFDRNEIVAATFGQPGVLDFDIAQRVAAAVGVRHETLDTRYVEWTTEDLIASVEARRWPMPFPLRQRYLSYHLHRKMGPDNVFWDGLCGDVVGGDEFRDPSVDWDWNSAREAFVIRNAIRGGHRLVRKAFQPFDVLPTEPFWPVERLSFPDQLELGLRQTCRIGTRIMTSYPTRTPFLSRPWLDFMLLAPTDLRYGKQLYRQVLDEAFPALFEIPNTSTPRSAQRPRLQSALPQIARRVQRAVVPRSVERNCWRESDAGANASILRGIGTRADITAVVEEAVNNLVENGAVPWVDVRALWKQHMSGEEDHHRSLDVLTSLDLNLNARPVPSVGDATPLSRLGES